MAYTRSMIGFILLGAALLSPIGAQEYIREARPSRTSFSDLEDDVRYEKPTTPIPILKQIDKHNEDGSYTFGFEAADGSFKIETKEANGEVRGKYGYTDADGKLHVVEYGANKYGFQPSGEGITVPPLNIGPDEPEEELEEAPRPAPRPRPPQPRPQATRPAPPPAQWQQVSRPAPPPAPRPRPQEPHIIYSQPAQVPAPRRPIFVAGAQPVAEESYDYDDSPPARPAAPRPAPRPAPVPARPQVQPYALPPPQERFALPPQPTRAQYASPKPAQDAFIPSAEFRQAINFAQPNSRPELSFAQPRPEASFAQPRPAKPIQFEQEEQQFFRPEPVRAQINQFANTQASFPQQAAPRPKPKATKPRGGFLDQLEEQYSLPQGGQPTHDISFGFY